MNTSTLDIDSSVLDSDISEGSLITSNNFRSYNFFNASVYIELTVDLKVYSATLQTGQSYHQGDYSLPSNHLSVYEGCELLEQLGACCEGELESQDFIDVLNEEAEASFSKEQIIEIYQELNSIINEAQTLVDEAEAEADKAFEADDSFYVMYTQREEVEVSEGIFVSRQCQESYSIRFDTIENAEKFINEKQASGDIAYLCKKEIAASYCHEYLSNF